MKNFGRRLQPFAQSLHLKDKRAVNSQANREKLRGDSIMTTAKNVRVARFVVAFGVAALSCGAAQAHPADRSDAKGAQAVVNYTDLDLSKEADVRSLYTRLQRASARVCGDYKDVRILSVKRAYEACYQETLSRAVDAVDHAAVTAMYAADSRTKVAGRVAEVSANT
jgi:UrcA family protein